MVACLQEGDGVRTIDEVIFCLEDRQKTEDWNVCDDAIQYLREFNELAKMWNDKLDKEQENPPLTWEQLKQMEGKPVWVEFTYHNPEETYKYWTIVKYFDNDDGGDMVFTGTGFYHKDLLGVDWQAYRKEKL